MSTNPHAAAEKGRRTRRARVVALLAGIGLLTGACAAGSESTGSAPATSARPPSTSEVVSGLVDIGGGRKMFATCRGTGSPTVVLIAGKGNGADDWQQILEPADPAHATAGDDVGAGMGKLVRSDDAVLPSVARFTRVCTYDRPDVRIGADDVTTPRTQPHTVDLDVGDLRALLTALGEPGPYVLVAHSYGGLIAELYARTYPSSVAGVVMVDAASHMIEDVVSKTRLENWDATNAATSPQSREGVKVLDAIRQIDSTGPWPNVPVVVLSSDKPWRVDLVPPEARAVESVTYENWLESVGRLAAVLGVKHISQTNSGHDIYLYAPQLVIDAIRAVVDDARTGTRSSTGTTR